MIRIVIKHDSSGEFTELVTSGHADSAPYGEDLVCAAVSGIVLGGINALKGNDYKLKSDEKSGKLQLLNIGEMSSHDKIVIETIVSQLQAIARDNPKFVNLSID